jgi:protein arginine N-methyltransferase 1
MVNGYTLFEYGLMIADRVRMEAHARALRQAVKPGSVVVDIGTGPGLFALLACRLGARRVYAIEPHDIIQLGRELALANGCAERITFIQDLSTRVTLPERADVIVADVRGALPERQLATLIDARRRLLAPGGTLIPRRDVLWAAVVQAPEVYGRQVLPWDEGGLDFGLDLKAARRMATNQVNTWRKGRMAPEQFLVEPRQWATIDYAEVEGADISAEVSWTVLRPGTGHGVVAWFDTMLAEGVGFSNTPLAPELVYGSAFFPWTEPVPLAAGETVAVALRVRAVGEDNVWCWDTRVTERGDPRRVKAGFRQSEFFGTPLSARPLRKQDAGHVPLLSLDGQVDQFILSLMDGRTSLGEVARRAADRFPGRFPRWEDALTRAGLLAAGYAG